MRVFDSWETLEIEGDGKAESDRLEDGFVVGFHRQDFCVELDLCQLVLGEEYACGIRWWVPGCEL